MVCVLSEIPLIQVKDCYSKALHNWFCVSNTHLSKTGLGDIPAYKMGNVYFIKTKYNGQMTQKMPRISLTAKQKLQNPKPKFISKVYYKEDWTCGDLSLYSQNNVV